MPSALVAADREGRIVWANHAAEALLGPVPAGATLARALGMADPVVAALQAADGAEHAFDHEGAALAASATRAADDTLLVALRRRDAERRLAAEADELRTLLDIACSAGRLGRFERDLRTGRGRWDRAMYAMRGLVGEGDAPMIDEVDAAVRAADREGHVASIRATLSRPGRQRFRYHVRTPAGQVRSLLCECLVIAGADGRAARAIGFELDDTLFGSLGPGYDSALSQLAMGSDLTGIIVWRQDIATDRFHYSPRASTVLGLPPAPDGVPGEVLRALVHPDDLPTLQAQSDAALVGDHPVEAEIRYRRTDRAGWRTLLTRRAAERDAEGRAVAFIGVSMDVSERVDESRRAAELHRRFELATRAAGIGYWSADPDSDRAVWNAEFRAINGLAPGEPVPSFAEWLARFVHPEDRDALARRFADWKASGQARLDVDFRIVRPDGEVRELNAYASHDAGGDGTAFGLVLDVTDRRQAEAARHERELAQRESQAQSRFLSRMSHELRTPLHAVLGFTDLLLADCADDDATRRRRLRAIRTAGAQLLALVDDVLDVARTQGGELRIADERVELAPLIEQVLESVEPLRAGQRVAIEAEPLAGAVRGDELRLRQVLQNLLTNAIKYNRSGGSVRVHRLAAQRPGELRLAVDDTGRGMDECQLRELFQPFNRLGAEREAIPGTGIGLVIVKSLVERMGGSVHVDSRPGVGSRFELRLPEAATLPPARLAPGPRSGRPLPPARSPVATLLYVEDNAVNAQIVVELAARRADLRLVVAEDGESGLRRAAELQPDLILLDMQLPDIDGREVLRRLRAGAATARIPVVVLSASAMPEDVEAALAAGGIDYWTKPLDLDAFMASIDSMFRVAAATN